MFETNVLMKIILSPIMLIFLIETVTPYDLLIVNSQDGEPYTTVADSMIKALEDKGYKHGVNLQISSWSIANREGMARRVWLTEKETSYDVIFLNGTVAAQNFKTLAYGDNQYKFVFGAVTDPVGIGLIENFDDFPKSNFTGVSYPVRVENRLSFIRELMPEAKTIGLIYADMPQSNSYIRWVEDELKKEEFSDLKFIFRSVEFIERESGHIRMTMLAEEYIHELDPLVDLFISPNDQMGVQEPFPRTVYSIATKPLLGIGRKDVIDQWGATMSLYPSLVKMGEQSAHMIIRLFEGEEIRDIKPQWPEEGMAFDLTKMDRFHIPLPEVFREKAKNNTVR